MNKFTLSIAALLLLSFIIPGSASAQYASTNVSNNSVVNTGISNDIQSQIKNLLEQIRILQAQVDSKNKNKRIPVITLARRGLIDFEVQTGLGFTIFGTNLGENSQETKIYIGDNLLAASHVAPTSIYARVPVSIIPGSYYLTVVNSRGTSAPVKLNVVQGITESAKGPDLVIKDIYAVKRNFYGADEGLPGIAAKICNIGDAKTPESIKPPEGYIITSFTVIDSNRLRNARIQDSEGQDRWKEVPLLPGECAESAAPLKKTLAEKNGTFEVEAFVDAPMYTGRPNLIVETNESNNSFRKKLKLVFGDPRLYDDGDDE